MARGRPPLKPLRNPEPRPCAWCGQLFWHESFHRRSYTEGPKLRKTCGPWCYQRLRMRTRNAKGAKALHQLPPEGAFNTVIVYWLFAHAPEPISFAVICTGECPIVCVTQRAYRDWETDRKSTRLNSSHSAKSRMPSSA